jgi:phosphate transport system substrate-binding protein
MKKCIFLLWAITFSFVGFASVSTLYAGEVLRYACSAQIYDAVEKERIKAFTQKTGIRVYVDVWTSGSAVNALMKGQSDIASSTRALYYRHKEYGYLDTPFCRDPLAIIVNTKNPIAGLSEEEIVDLFGGNIGNWKELGGPDQPIVIIIPGKNTGAYRNFRQTPMQRKEIVFDLMSYQSTTVVDAVKRYPWSVSFITHGASRGGDVKVLKVDGLSPGDRDYPYHQEFHFITGGKPSGPAKLFIEYALSEEGERLLKANGMIPVSLWKEKP